jgi:hypothetical protein
MIVRRNIYSVLLLSIMTWLLLAAARLPNPPLRQQGGQCPAVLQAFVGDHKRLETLLNPVLTSEQQVQEALGFYRQLEPCLAQVNSTEANAVLDSIDWFTAFTYAAVPVPTSRSTISLTQLVDLGTAHMSDPAYVSSFLFPLDAIDDPAIQRLKNKIKLPTPPGYIYLRFFSPYGDIPGVVGHVFASNMQIKGFANCRYVAILVDEPGKIRSKGPQRDQLIKTIAHELVHAFVKPSLGCNDNLPRWFHEGIAIHLSGSGDLEYVIQPDGTTFIKTDPVQYQQFEDNFAFLENKLGKDRFYDAIARSFAERSEKPLLRDAGFATEQLLAQQAREWSKQRGLRFGLLLIPVILIGGVVLVGLIFFLAVALSRSGRELSTYTEPIKESSWSAPRPRRRAAESPIYTWFKNILQRPARPPGRAGTPAIQTLVEPAPIRLAPAASTADTVPLPVPAPVGVVVRPDAELVRNLKVYLTLKGTSETATLGMLWQFVLAHPLLTSEEALRILDRALAAIDPKRRMEADKRRALLSDSRERGIAIVFFGAQLKAICREVLDALRTGDQARRLELATSIDTLATQDLPVAGARDFLVLLADWLRGQEITVRAALLRPVFRKNYQLMAQVSSLVQPGKA